MVQHLADHSTHNTFSCCWFIGDSPQNKVQANMVLGVGVVGLGKMGLLHAGIINSLPSGRVVAICEKEGMLVKAARQLLPSISFYDTVDAMLEKERLDAIYVTTPIQTHARIIETIVDSLPSAGIFSEKPLAADTVEARKIAEMVSSKKVVNMVGLQKRFGVTFKRAKQLLDAGAIGRVQFFRSGSYVSDIFRHGVGWRFQKGSGGVLLDLSPHLIDLLLWYFEDVKVLSAVGKSFYSSEVEDYVHATLETRAGAVGSFEVSWSARNYRIPEIMIEVQGDGGSLTITDDHIEIDADQSLPGIIASGKSILRRADFDTSVPFLLADPEFTVEDEYFLTTVLNGLHAQPDFEAGVRVNEFIDMVHRGMR